MIDCRFENDVLDALRTGRWPARADADLRAHVDACAVCSDLVLVAGALLEDRHPELPFEHPLPSADVVWCRARMRARHEAARAAARPIALAQGIAVGCALGLAMAAFGFGWPWLSSWATWFWGAVPTVNVASLDVALVEQPLPRLAVAALAAFLVCVAIPATIVIVLSDEA